MSADAFVFAPPQGGNPGKLASVVARRITDDVIRAGWRVGTVLGSETDLRTRYGVSRAVFREAVRLVEHQTIATMRRGPNGGLVVCEPSVMPSTLAMTVYLEHIGASVTDLMGARLVLEPLAASLAAGALTEAGVGELRGELVAEAHHSARHLALATSDALHVRIAELCGNELLGAFIGVLAALTGRYAGRRRQPAGGAESVGVGVRAAHAAIVDAIVEGSASQAEHRMSEHLTVMADWLASNQATPRQRRNLRDIGGPSKRAEEVAAKIYEDVARSRARPGEVVGSESELLARYDVSRAVLREAVRLLEHHSIARMRRGPGGGLVLEDPDPRASIEAMANYLEYRGVTVEDLRTARDAVELACIDLLVARSQEPSLRRELEAGLLVGHETGPEDLAPLANDLHGLICTLAGNPVLTLFAQVTNALWSRHTRTRTGAPVPEIADAVERAHGAIIDAVLSGDAALARRRMRRHLTALSDWWEAPTGR